MACSPPRAQVSVPKNATPAARPVTTAEPSERLPQAVGNLERPRALARLFTALAQLEAGTATDDVRITQLGDSHTAADWQTGPVRRQLQERFGNGGRGFVPIGRPWPAWSQEGVLTGTAGSWTTAMNHPASRQPTGDGIFGLSGFALTTKQPGAAWVTVMTASSRAELHYLEQPGGGSFDFVIDGVRQARISTRAEQKQTAFHVAELSEPGRHRVEVRSLGDGDVRFFGLALDRAQHGLVFDALGINGARVATALSWNDALWGEDLHHRAPALVILAYGSNDAVDVQTSPDAFEAELTELLQRIARSVPTASCLVLGPTDRAVRSSDKTWTTPPRLLEFVTRERHAAEAAGCAFYDQMKAMGGEGSMARWATGLHPRGQQDRMHLTREGYAEVGGAFVSDLVGAYEQWKSDR